MGGRDSWLDRGSAEGYRTMATRGAWRIRLKRASFLAARAAVTLVAGSFIAMATLACFGCYIDFGTPAYYMSEGRLVLHFPFEWAENEYSQDMPFPIDTDSIVGIVTYWLPGDFSVGSGWSDGSWWQRFTPRPWLEPLDFSVDGEWAETGARPVPLSLLVYAAAPAAGALWFPWKRRRAGRCKRCGYDLAGLPGVAEHLVQCPECGVANTPAVDARTRVLTPGARWGA